MKKVLNLSKLIVTCVIVGTLMFLSNNIALANASEPTKYTEPSESFGIMIDYIMLNSAKRESVMTITQEMIDNKDAIEIEEFCAGGQSPFSAAGLVAMKKLRLENDDKEYAEESTRTRIINELISKLNIEKSKIKYQSSYKEIPSETIPDQVHVEDRISVKIDKSNHGNFNSYDVYSVAVGTTVNESTSFEDLTPEQLPIALYWVKTEQAVPQNDEDEEKSDIEIIYTAEVDDNGTKSGVSCDIATGTIGDYTGKYAVPSFDKTKPLKDANVLVKIKANNGKIIKSVADEEVDVNGNINKSGWYFVNKDDKTVVAKSFEYSQFDNIDKNGLAILKDLKITFDNDETTIEDVAIMWPFRIIDVQYNPEKIDANTEKVVVTVLTNLPMDKDKLPEGWSFTEDDLGKNFHKITKEFLKSKGEEQKQKITLTPNGRTGSAEKEIVVSFKTTQSSGNTSKPDTAPNHVKAGDNAILIFGGVVAILVVGVVIYRKKANK